MSETRNETEEIDHLLSVEYIYDLYESDQLGCLKAIILNFELQSFTVKEVPDDAIIQLVSSGSSIDVYELNQIEC